MALLTGHDDPDVSRLRLTPTAVMQVIAWIIGLLLTYGAVTNRLTAVETRQGESDRRQGEADRRMERMEGKIDVLLQRGQAR